MMPLTRLESVAAVLRETDIDTDVIYPARFLLLTTREGLGRYAFHDWRYDSSGGELADFVLNLAPLRGTQVLIAGRNFGCGSSREQAPWALADLGIRCVLAESFGEIFESNCFGSGILPVRVDATQWPALAAAAEAGHPVSIDLFDDRIGCGDLVLPIPVPGWRRDALLNGWDEIDRVLAQQLAAIDAFEARQRQQLPWLYPTSMEQPCSPSPSGRESG